MTTNPSRRYKSRTHTVDAVQWDGTAEGATPIIDWVLAEGGNARFDTSSAVHPTRLILTGWDHANDVADDRTVYPSGWVLLRDGHFEVSHDEFVHRYEPLIVSGIAGGMAQLFYTHDELGVLGDLVDRALEVCATGELPMLNSLRTSLREAQYGIEQYVEPDRRPHSRACGMRNHDHGQACAQDCPTCHGRPA